MINDVDETLSRLVVAELMKLPDCPVRHRDQITFDPPSVAEMAQDGEARVNVFLHDVRENLERRDEGFRVKRQPGQVKMASIGRPPVYMDLSYLVTAYAGNDPPAEHRLLSQVLGVLLRCLSAAEPYLAGSLVGKGPNAVHIAVAQPEHLSAADPSSLWQALGGTMRPSLSLLVTAPFDPFETRSVAVVQEAVMGIGQGTPPHGPQRPLDMLDVLVSAAGVVMEQRENGSVPLEGVAVSVEGSKAAAITDLNGFFYLLNLPTTPQKQLLRFRKRGYEVSQRETEPPSTGHPERLALLEVTLQPLDDSARAAEEAATAAASRNAWAASETGRISEVSLSGRLKLADGRPAAYVPVRSGTHCTTTDGDGVFTFFDLPGSDHAVVVELPGCPELALSPGMGWSAEAGTVTLPPRDAAASE